MKNSGLYGNWIVPKVYTSLFCHTCSFAVLISHAFKGFVFGVVVLFKQKVFLEIRGCPFRSTVCFISFPFLFSPIYVFACVRVLFQLNIHIIFFKFVNNSFTQNEALRTWDKFHLNLVELLLATCRWSKLFLRSKGNWSKSKRQFVENKILSISAS